MDQCGNCTLKGDLIKCKEAPCSHHETWYAVTQQKLIEELEFTIKVLATPIDELKEKDNCNDCLLVTDCTKEN